MNELNLLREYITQAEASRPLLGRGTFRLISILGWVKLLIVVLVLLFAGVWGVKIAKMTRSAEWKVNPKHLAEVESQLAKNAANADRLQLEIASMQGVFPVPEMLDFIQAAAGGKIGKAKTLRYAYDGRGSIAGEITGSVAIDQQASIGDFASSLNEGFAKTFPAFSKAVFAATVAKTDASADGASVNWVLRFSITGVSHPVLDPAALKTDVKSGKKDSKKDTAKNSAAKGGKK